MFWSIAVFFDFKKAFDSLDHQLPVRKLESYGVRAVPYCWFRGYLCERYQSVYVISKRVCDIKACLLTLFFLNLFVSTMEFNKVQFWVHFCSFNTLMTCLRLWRGVKFSFTLTIPMLYARIFQLMCYNVTSMPFKTG